MFWVMHRRRPQDGWQITGTFAVKKDAEEYARQLRAKPLNKAHEFAVVQVHVQL